MNTLKQNKDDDKKTTRYVWTTPASTEGMTEEEKDDALYEWYKFNNAREPWNSCCCFCEAELPNGIGHNIAPIPDASPSIHYRARKHPDLGYRACGECNSSRVIPIRMCMSFDNAYFDDEGYICKPDGRRY